MATHWARGETGRQLVFTTITWMIPGVAITQVAPDLSSRVDAYLAPLIEANDFAGVVLITRGEEILVRWAYGFADRARFQRQRPSRGPIRDRRAARNMQFRICNLKSDMESRTESAPLPLPRNSSKPPG